MSSPPANPGTPWKVNGDDGTPNLNAVSGADHSLSYQQQPQSSPAQQDKQSTSTQPAQDESVASTPNAAAPPNDSNTSTAPSNDTNSKPTNNTNNTSTNNSTSVDNNNSSSDSNTTDTSQESISVASPTDSSPSVAAGPSNELSVEVDASDEERKLEPLMEGEQGDYDDNNDEFLAQAISDVLGPDVDPSVLIMSPRAKQHRRANKNDRTGGLTTGQASLTDYAGGATAGFGFVKKLDSDMSDDRAYELLKKIVEEQPDLFEGFTVEDLCLFSSILSVLYIPNDTIIVKKDEVATFFGIILEGEFTVLLGEKKDDTAPTSPKMTSPRSPRSPRSARRRRPGSSKGKRAPFSPRSPPQPEAEEPVKSVVLSPGAVVGEMSFFEGGKRSADIRCSSERGGILATLRYPDLVALGRTSVVLQFKIVRMLATASMRKLRNTISRNMVTYVSKMEEKTLQLSLKVEELQKLKKKRRTKSKRRRSRRSRSRKSMTSPPSSAGFHPPTVGAADKTVRSIIGATENKRGEGDFLTMVDESGKLIEESKSAVTSDQSSAERKQSSLSGPLSESLYQLKLAMTKVSQSTKGDAADEQETGSPATAESNERVIETEQSRIRALESALRKTEDKNAQLKTVMYELSKKLREMGNENQRLSQKVDQLVEFQALNGFNNAGPGPRPRGSISGAAGAVVGNKAVNSKIVEYALRNGKSGRRRRKSRVASRTPKSEPGRSSSPKKGPEGQTKRIKSLQKEVNMLRTRLRNSSSSHTGLGECANCGHSLLESLGRTPTPDPEDGTEARSSPRKLTRAATLDPNANSVVSPTAGSGENIVLEMELDKLRRQLHRQAEANRTLTQKNSQQNLQLLKMQARVDRMTLSAERKVKMSKEHLLRLKVASSAAIRRSGAAERILKLFSIKTFVRGFRLKKKMFYLLALAMECCGDVRFNHEVIQAVIRSHGPLTRGDSNISLSNDGIDNVLSNMDAYLNKTGSMYMREVENAGATLTNANGEPLSFHQRLLSTRVHESKAPNNPDSAGAPSDGNAVVALSDQYSLVLGEAKTENGDGKQKQKKGKTVNAGGVEVSAQKHDMSDEPEQNAASLLEKRLVKARRADRAQLRKKFTALRTARIPMYQLCDHLQDTLRAIQLPMQSMLSHVCCLYRLCNGFFERNIELCNQIMTLKDQLERRLNAKMHKVKLETDRRIRKLEQALYWQRKKQVEGLRRSGMKVDDPTPPAWLVRQEERSRSNRKRAGSERKSVLERADVKNRSRKTAAGEDSGKEGTAGEMLDQASQDNAKIMTGMDVESEFVTKHFASEDETLHFLDHFARRKKTCKEQARAEAFQKRRAQRMHAQQPEDQSNSADPEASLEAKDADAGAGSDKPNVQRSRPTTGPRDSRDSQSARTRRRTQRHPKTRPHTGVNRIQTIRAQIEADVQRYEQETMAWRRPQTAGAAYPAGPGRWTGPPQEPMQPLPPQPPRGPERYRRPPVSGPYREQASHPQVSVRGPRPMSHHGPAQAMGPSAYTRPQSSPFVGSGNSFAPSRHPEPVLVLHPGSNNNNQRATAYPGQVRTGNVQDRHPTQQPPRYPSAQYRQAPRTRPVSSSQNARYGDSHTQHSVFIPTANTVFYGNAHPQPPTTHQQPAPRYTGGSYQPVKQSGAVANGASFPIL